MGNTTQISALPDPNPSELNTSKYASARYTLSTSLSKADAPDFESAKKRVIDAFAAHGFGLPPGTLDARFDSVMIQKKLVSEFREYGLLGFCNPTHALRIVQAEPAAGTLLPCVVVVQRNPSTDGFEVTAIDPTFQLSLSTHPEVQSVGAQARVSIVNALEDLRERRFRDLPGTVRT